MLLRELRYVRRAQYYHCAFNTQPFVPFFMGSNFFKHFYYLFREHSRQQQPFTVKSVGLSLGISNYCLCFCRFMSRQPNGWRILPLHWNSYTHIPRFRKLFSCLWKKNTFQDVTSLEFLWGEFFHTTATNSKWIMKNISGSIKCCPTMPKPDRNLVRSEKPLSYLTISVDACTIYSRLLACSHLVK